jgi:dGTPase
MALRASKKTPVSMPASSYTYSEAERRFLAPYASFSAESRGRLYKEPETSGRSCFQRDRDRIIHSAAFRRLEYKTQVFVNHEGDHYRTRLTHSLEVAQLARSAARELKLNEDLCEALALAHDLGHPPFGHAGEFSLQEVMKDFGGFDHNAQSLRVLTKLEDIYANFDGLNLSWETLEGVAKHNGPVVKKKGEKASARALREYVSQHDLELHTYPSLEAQVTALCDDIAYNNHDIEDGLRARLFKMEDLLDLPLVGEAFRDVLKKHPKIEEARLIHEARRRMINRASRDLVAQTEKIVGKAGVESAAAVRAYGVPLAGFSPEMENANRAIKAFLMENMYRHYKVNRMTSKASRLLKELFWFFLKEPHCLPGGWREKSAKPETRKTAELIADYIAGMTDRFAYEEYRRVFDMSYRIIGD